MICETVKVKCDNEQGYYICNADAVPQGAYLFGKKEISFEEAKELVAPVEQPKKRGRKPKAK